MSLEPFKFFHREVPELHAVECWCKNHNKCIEWLTPRSGCQPYINAGLYDRTRKVNKHINVFIVYTYIALPKRVPQMHVAFDIMQRPSVLPNFSLLYSEVFDKAVYKINLVGKNVGTLQSTIKASS